MFVDHTDQQFDVETPFGPCANWDDLLGVEAESILLKRLMDSADPLHLPTAQRNFPVVALVELNAVAALVLGYIARGIRRAQGLRRGKQSARDIYHADTYGDGK